MAKLGSGFEDRNWAELLGFANKKVTSYQL